MLKSLMTKALITVMLMATLFVVAQNEIVTEVWAQAPLNVPVAAWNRANIVATGSTAIKTTGGIIHCVDVVTKSTGTGTITLYNSLVTSGTAFIGPIDTTNQTGHYCFDVVSTTGITAQVSATTAGTIVISYR